MSIENCSHLVALPVFFTGCLKLINLIVQPDLYFLLLENKKYKIAKFLVPILQPLTLGPYTVKNSFSFVKEITSFHIDSDCVMLIVFLLTCLLLSALIFAVIFSLKVPILFHIMNVNSLVNNFENFLILLFKIIISSFINNCMSK